MVDVRMEKGKGQWNIEEEGGMGCEEEWGIGK